MMCLSVGFLALLYYDHILTLRDEIDLVWRAAPTIAKYALLVYRYGTLTSVTLIVYCKYLISRRTSSRPTINHSVVGVRSRTHYGGMSLGITFIHSPY